MTCRDFPYGLNQICLLVSLYAVVLFQPWKIEYIYELLIGGITEYIYEQFQGNCIHVQFCVINSDRVSLRWQRQH